MACPRSGPGAWDPWGLGSDPNSTAQAQGPCLHNGDAPRLTEVERRDPPRPAGWDTNCNTPLAAERPFGGVFAPPPPVCAPSGRWVWGSRPPGSPREGRRAWPGPRCANLREPRKAVRRGGSWTHSGTARRERPDRARCGQRGRSPSRGSGRPRGLERLAVEGECEKAKWEGAGLRSTQVAGRREVGVGEVRAESDSAPRPLFPIPGIGRGQGPPPWGASGSETTPFSSPAPREVRTVRLGLGRALSPSP